MKDFVKKKSKKSNIVSLYLNDDQLKALEILRQNDLNVSMICRYAIMDAAKKVINGDKMKSDAYSIEIIDNCIDQLKKLKITM